MPGTNQPKIHPPAKQRCLQCYAWVLVADIRNNRCPDCAPDDGDPIYRVRGAGRMF